MTLDEAIQHAREKAQEQRYYSNFEKGTMYNSCVKCAEEHEQLAKWLEELKLYKSKFKEILLYDHEIAEIKIYHKAIDDFRNAILRKYTEEERNNNFKFYACQIKQDIADIGEQVKVGGEDE